MILKRMLPFSKELLERACQKGDIVIDATMGNGHDTRYLADLVGRDGQVFAFDVQKEAIEQTSKRLGEHYPNVHLIHDGHEQLAERSASGCLWSHIWCSVQSWVLTRRR